MKVQRKSRVLSVPIERSGMTCGYARSPYGAVTCRKLEVILFDPFPGSAASASGVAIIAGMPNGGLRAATL